MTAYRAVNAMHYLLGEVLVSFTSNNNKSRARLQVLGFLCQYTNRLGQYSKPLKEVFVPTEKLGIEEPSCSQPSSPKTRFAVS